MKYGETARGFYKSHKMSHMLKRVQEQFNRARRRGDFTEYRQRIVRRFTSKGDAKKFETNSIRESRKTDLEALPWNKGDT